MKTRLLGFLVLTLVVVLTGCSGSNSAEPKSTVTPWSGTTTKFTPTPDPERPYEFSVECLTEDYQRIEFDDYKMPWSWSAPLRSCEGSNRTGTMLSDVQEAALTMAYGTTDVSSLGTLYGICADVHFSHYGSLPSYAAGQVRELQAALTLCPDQPAAAALQAKLGASTTMDAERAAGTRFSGGIRRVGAELQPGVYVSEGAIENCYWERLDAAGNIIDNNFLASALRVEVRVDSSDFSFSSTGCGEWVKQG